MKPRLTIVHLYPKRMSIYGDRGNIMALMQRSAWRGITATVHQCEVGEDLPDDADLYFFGGGQDQEQTVTSQDLRNKQAALKDAVANRAVLLAICGGYQLLGRYYQPAAGPRIDGIGIFDAWTEAGSDRLIGNVVADLQISALAGQPLVGFENHSGLTHLGPHAKPLAKIRSGYGNNGRDGYEGCVSGTAIGTYLHGALLPKNPGLADYLLANALKRRFPDYELRPLDDRLEQAANRTAVARFA